jgi:zinc-ribbon domain
MFCPRCATQNVDGASYCRACGANISLIPQALTGQLPQPLMDESLAEDRHGRRRRRRPRPEATIESALVNAFMGVAFLAVSISLAFSAVGRFWWFWLLIPAFSMLGRGVASYARLKDEEKKRLASGGNFSMPIQARTPQTPSALASPNTGELQPPASVTEGTTRHLGAEIPTVHLDASRHTGK